MILTATTLAVSTGIQSSFLASGGTGAVTYEVIKGGAGGTINASTGIYVAPASLGYQPNQISDTILATDSIGNIAQATILIGTPLFLVADILQSELGLADDQVYLWDQKINIPNDFRLYIVVGILSCKPFGNSTTFNSDGTTTQSVNMQATLSLDIFSRSSEARDRKEEVVMALNSQYAEQQQEINSFSIGNLPVGFVNLSEVEGAAILYRFNLSVNILYSTTKTKPVDYFDEFSTTTVTTEP